MLEPGHGVARHSLDGQFPAMTHTDWLRQLFVRELKSLITELEFFPGDEVVWATAPGVSNSAGTLALHCCGNLQYFIGTVLGGTGYVRKRDLEFSLRDVPRAALIAEITATIGVVDSVLAGRNDALLLEQYPDVPGGLRLPCGLWLLHLSVHLGYHIGQVGYLRRIITGDATGSGAINMTVLRGSL